MDYVVGSVAALISGNVTPNRPKLLRKALTPTKHQPSPNVTPKSEFVDDRSIFLSPTQQKKKAIIKKSPKRIFQNPDLDTTEDDKDSTLPSPKTEKVKKHLEEELNGDDGGKNMKKSPSHKLNESAEISPKKKSDSPNKKKKKRDSESNDATLTGKIMSDDEKQPDAANSSPKKGKKRRKSIAEVSDKLPDEETEESSPNKKSKPSSKDQNEINIVTKSVAKKKKNKKGKNKKIDESEGSENVNKENKLDTAEIKKAKKKKNKLANATTIETEDSKSEKMDTGNESDSDGKETTSKNIANPNAITNKDSDSEHDSDDDIESENEQSNEKVLTNEGDEQSSDEEETKEEKKVESKYVSEEEIKRTLFVGNVPFSSKCKKEIKKIFSQYGQIETVRIRTIPVKDSRVTPKLAVIKNELHPERSTVNVYVKFAHEDSVTKALKANNTVLNGHHLRVTRSESTGTEHDPRCAVFIGNLPFAIEDETLRSKFEGCGEIVSVRVIRDKKTNAGKGFGYVNFASKDGVELALAMSEEDLTIKNRIIRVKRCTQFGNKAKKQITSQKFGGRQKWGKNQDINNQGRGQAKWGQARTQDDRNQGQREETGAARRLMFKRKQQDATGGPPNKRPNANKEKKPKKEFVGMTAEKKKKQKFNKDHKKKKALSEILMKK